jgi:hypothetical protein
MKPSTQCSIDGCASTVTARGWCGKHYDRWRRNGDPTKVRGATECAEHGCRRMTVGQGWCSTHYSRYVKAPQGRERRLAAKTGRLCAHCGNQISPDRRSRALFCSVECKRRDFVESGAQRASVLRSYYKRNYALTLEQAEDMRRTGCAICARTTGIGRFGQLHIDHDHVTGEVRGVLCHECNTGLGKFKDDPDLLAAAIKYLTR